MQPQENKWLTVTQPLQPPAINPQLETLGALTRSTLCLQHFLLGIEYWLSPNGRLRWWLKINGCLCAWLFIPAIVLMPIVSLVLHEVDGMVTVVTNIVLKLFVLSILISVAVLAIKHFPSSSQGSSRRRK